MATISPAAVSLEPSAAQLFTTDISSPVWTLHGVGSLNSSGLYTAPDSSGSAIIEAATSFWATHNATKFTKNSDDSLTVTSNGYGFADAKANFKLTQNGDYVEITAWENDPFWITFDDGATNKFFGLYHGNVRERFSGVDTTHGAVSIANGDKIKILLNSSGKFEFYKNNSLLHTSINTFTGVDLHLGLSNTTATSTVIKKPLVSGTGITNYTFAQAVVTILLPLLLPRRNDLELYCDANLMTLSDGASVTSFTDQSAHARHLTNSADYPTFETNEINSKPVISWNGSKKPLKNNAVFTVACGWIVAKFNTTVFSGFEGLLTDLAEQSILVSNSSGTDFFAVGYEFFEFRTNERIYPAENAPAPMEEFSIIFFRFWQPITVNGIQLGQQTTFTSRKLDGDVALVALYSGGFCESDIQKYSQDLALHFDLELADVYPFIADKQDSPQSPVQAVNFYDPPEGERISEVLDNAKTTFDLNFSNRRRNEVKRLREFWQDHYAAALPFIYRNYRFIPPEDIEGYFDSPYELDGANGNYNYSFRFREK